MATLTIRNLPRDVHVRLRIRAARAGRSMEAEARAILAETCAPEKSGVSGGSIQEWVDQLYGEGKPRGVVEELLADRRRESLVE